MKKLILYTLALCCLPAQARALRPQTSGAQWQQQEAQKPPAAAPAAALPPAPAPTVRIEPAKLISDELFKREMKDVSGRSFYLADYRGRVFVVNLWASWCGPCRLEIPGLNRVYEHYRTRGVEFVGLTGENPAADAKKVAAFMRELKMSYKVGWLDLETARELMGGRYVLPQTFVVGADGRVVLHLRGYNERVPEMIRAGLDRALASAPSAAAPPPAPAAGP